MQREHLLTEGILGPLLKTLERWAESSIGRDAAPHTELQSLVALLGALIRRCDYIGVSIFLSILESCEQGLQLNNVAMTPSLCELEAHFRPAPHPHPQVQNSYISIFCGFERFERCLLKKLCRPQVPLF